MNTQRFQTTTRLAILTCAMLVMGGTSQAMMRIMMRTKFLASKVLAGTKQFANKHKILSIVGINGGIFVATCKVTDKLDKQKEKRIDEKHRQALLHEQDIDYPSVCIRTQKEFVSKPAIEYVIQILSEKDWPTPLACLTEARKFIDYYGNDLAQYIFRYDKVSHTFTKITRLNDIKQNDLGNLMNKNYTYTPFYQSDQSDSKKVALIIGTSDKSLLEELPFLSWTSHGIYVMRQDRLEARIKKEKRDKEDLEDYLAKFRRPTGTGPA